MSDRDSWENPVLKIRLLQTLEEEGEAKRAAREAINLPEAQSRLRQHFLSAAEYVEGAFLKLGSDDSPAPEPQSEEQLQTYSASSSFAP